MAPLDLRALRAFLEPSHRSLAATASHFAADELLSLPVPADDGEARTQARKLVASIGEAGLYEAISRRDLRGCCLVREALAWASPLADAVFALQALSTTPLLLGGGEAAREGPRGGWIAAALSGEAMGAFAMTEKEAGSDVGSMTTRARRDGADYILEGAKTLISNAGIAAFHVVFASTDPESGSRGITAFLVPSGTEGLHFLGPQVMSAPHPLGRSHSGGAESPRRTESGRRGRDSRSGWRLSTGCGPPWVPPHAGWPLAPSTRR